MHPILVHIGSFSVYTYGFFVTVAVFAVFTFALKNASRFGFSKQDLSDLILVMFIGGIIGARFFYVLQHWEDFNNNIWRMINIREGGLVWYGGFLSGVSSGLFVAWKKGMPLLRLCDFFSPILPGAQAIGRLGCFFNGCCYGRFTHSKLSVLFPGDLTPRYPVQIFESVLLIGLSLFIYLRQKKDHAAGELFSLYLFFYGALRFVLEYLRGDQTLLAFFTIPQWASLLLIFSGIFLRFKLTAKKK